KKIAEKFNTNHHEIKLTPSHFLSELEPALNAMDHPGGDGPNTYIVSKATKNAGITVALSGIGGDELFAGYANFKRLHSLQNKWLLKATPGFILKAGGFALKQSKKSISNYKIAEILSHDKFDLKEMYPLSRSVFTSKELNKIISSSNGSNKLKELIKEVKLNPTKILSAISCMEIKSYLLNVLLRDTDQMSMAVALEVREPFLDYKLTEFVLGISDEYKMPVTPKKLLTDSVGDLIPNDIINRPKMGFTLPWQHWLKNELKNFCTKNIEGLENKKLLNEGAAMELWNRFLNNDPLITWSRVWHLIVLNHWLDSNKINCN
ncbi:MAG: asparagine synthase, partial [Bacteroidia bacterium]|nr:asparagine synthase [Bacteroidia bacterium]